MEKLRVLFVSQEITPYLQETHMGHIARHLPQGIQERSREIRTFMPRFGNINERRNQLHEVIRLSGMNLIINDTDHPLLIKVASIQSARMQIYFIDNEDYFQRKFVFHDKNEKFFEDNDERSIFFCRGVLETVKKLGWSPDIVHCHGWFSSLIPLYIKKAFNDNPLFTNSKVIVSIYDTHFTETLDKKFSEKIILNGINPDDVKQFGVPNSINLIKGALDFADGVIIGSENPDPELLDYAKSLNKKILGYHPEETYIDAYSEFYDEILSTECIS